MRASPAFFGRHLVAIHATAWAIIVGIAACDGYFDLPHLLSVPLSASVVLLGVPFIVVFSVRGPAPDISLPESLRRFIRYSPFYLGGLWMVCMVWFIVVMIGEFHVRSIL